MIMYVRENNSSCPRDKERKKKGLLCVCVSKGSRTRGFQQVGRPDTGQPAFQRPLIGALAGTTSQPTRKQRGAGRLIIFSVLQISFDFIFL